MVSVVYAHSLFHLFGVLFTIHPAMLAGLSLLSPRSSPISFLLFYSAWESLQKAWGISRLCFSYWPSTNFLMFCASARTLLGRFQGSCLRWSLSLFGQLSFASISCWNSKQIGKISHKTQSFSAKPTGFGICCFGPFYYSRILLINFLSEITTQSVLNLKTRAQYYFLIGIPPRKQI